MDQILLTIKNIQTYVKPIVEIINIKLEPVYTKTLDLLSIDNANINCNIYVNTPIKFFSLILLGLFVLIYFMNHIICHLIAITIPVLATLESIKNKSNENSNIKYWVLFGLMILYEDTIEFIPAFFAIYYYLKFAFILGLIYNNFALSKFLFEFVYKYYQFALTNSIIKHKLEDLEEISQDIDSINLNISTNDE
jgi:hypothetical protein